MRRVPRFMLSSIAVGAALAALAFPSASGGADREDALVVSTSWLAQHQKDPDLVLLQVGPKEAYAAGHIPGARYVDFTEDLAVSDRSEHGLTLEMPPVGVLHDRLAGFGVSDRSRVVVYCAKGWVSAATRVMFTLDYVGLGSRSMLLDGGLEAWQKDGRPLSTDVPAPVAGSLSPLHVKPIVVDAAFVLAHLKAPGFAVVDGRAAAFYDGVETGGAPEHRDKTGHIAGALSIPYNSLNDEQAFLRTRDELAKAFAQAGVRPNDTVVGYCHVGMQATEMLFAARLLGHPVLLYDGSFQDWSRHADYPVINPRQQDAKP